MQSPERSIEQFPSPCHDHATPYVRYRFDGEVREFCEQDTLGQAHLQRVAKCILVGDIAVGKTSIINRSNYNLFTNNYKATIGVDFDVQKYSILKSPFTLQIWDTAGQERFKCIASTYYRGAHVSVITFDMSNVSTLASTRKWAAEVSESNNNLTSNRHGSPLLFLVGNKKELLCESAFEFVEKEAIKVANELNAEYWSVSAQTGENVSELFQRIAALAFHDMVWREIDDGAKVAVKKINYSNFIKITRDRSKKKKKHCVSVSCHS